MTHERNLTIAAAVLALAGCGSPAAPSAEPVAFQSTTSFGECLPTAYCRQRLDISMEAAVLTGESRALPSVMASRRLDAAEWTRLVAALDPAALRALPAVLGCPDCADGGAETLTVAFADGRATTVTFEYGHDVPGAQALLTEVRGIRASLR